MSYDVSEQPAQDHNGWYPPQRPAGPRHRHDGHRPPGSATGGHPVYQRPAEESREPFAESFRTGGYPSGAYPYGQDPRPDPQPDARQEPVPGGGYVSGGYPAYQESTPPVATGYGWAAATDQWSVTGPAQPEPPSMTQPVREQVTRSHDPAAAELRSQVVRRIRFMNFRHTEHAWDRRYRDPIGPHALAFLYSEPARGKPARYTLRTATRLFLAGPEVDDLPRLLHDMAGVVSRQGPGGYDPRVLADRTEEMSPGAFYVGLAVSSLDTPAGPWSHLKQRLAGSIDVPGRCYALLTDDTMVLLDRGGESRFGHFEVRATDSLDEIPGESMQRWTYDRSLREMSDPATSDIWRGMLELHNTIMGRAADEQ
jgi:hypothetical protein